MKKLISLVLGLLMFLGLCTGCKEPAEDFLGLEGSDGLGSKAVANQSGLTAFSYSFSDCTVDGGHTYTVEDGTVLLELGRYGNGYGTLTCPAESALLDALNDLYLKHNVAAWDGYHKVATNVLDGDGFYMTLGFADGKSMSCSGSNCYPEGYSPFCKEMEALFAPIAARLKEEARQKIIAEGLHGQVNGLWLNLVGHGSSGTDEYRIGISPSEDDIYTLEATVKSVSGDFLPEGEHSFERSKPLDMEQLQALIEKYDLITWYNYDRTAADYSNCEWFQLDLRFDDGFCISAMGTEHPEHYDEFRQELLTLVLQWAQED